MRRENLSSKMDHLGRENAPPWSRMGDNTGICEKGLETGAFSNRQIGGWASDWNVHKCSLLLTPAEHHRAYSFAEPFQFYDGAADNIGIRRHYA
ncbi:hypothetical protein AVEN_203989-1 [Araneus ventricosus]|uniref:Uncharacterized protein n=1 Tax=Araneus ventricosus TaxID=182803 RepID=A0A4Y2VM06_ARAVE|nr:hypothetical protein AVEN_203989-1 [Araneus ventricosus]